MVPTGGTPPTGTAYLSASLPFFAPKTVWIAVRGGAGGGTSGAPAWGSRDAHPAARDGADDFTGIAGVVKFP